MPRQRLWLISSKMAAPEVCIDCFTLDLLVVCSNTYRYCALVFNSQMQKKWQKFGGRYCIFVYRRSKVLVLQPVFHFLHTYIYLLCTYCESIFKTNTDISMEALDTREL